MHSLQARKMCLPKLQNQRSLMHSSRNAIELQAEAGIAALREHCDTLIVVPNQRLLDTAEAGATMEAAFELADDMLRQGVQARVRVCGLLKGLLVVAHPKATRCVR
jgi:cell division GTPase FtsZ